VKEHAQAVPHGLLLDAQRLRDGCVGPTGEDFGDQVPFAAREPDARRQIRHTLKNVERRSNARPANAADSAKSDRRTPTMSNSVHTAPASGGLLEAESSLRLLERARAGDAAALNVLMGRYLPRLRRWASGRLPRWARDVADTQDLVQDVVLQTFKNIETFEPRNEGALQAYLRQSIVNRIRDELRRTGRRPAAAELDVRMPDDGASPLEEAIGREALDRYERALMQLREQDREAIIARVELDCSNEEIAVALGKPSANAARMAVERALLRLADAMRRAARGAAEDVSRGHVR